MVLEKCFGSETWRQAIGWRPLDWLLLLGTHMASAPCFIWFCCAQPQSGEPPAVILTAKHRRADIAGSTSIKSSLFFLLLEALDLITFLGIIPVLEAHATFCALAHLCDILFDVLQRVERARIDCFAVPNHTDLVRSTNGAVRDFAAGNFDFLLLDSNLEDLTNFCFTKRVA